MRQKNTQTSTVTTNVDNLARIDLETAQASTSPQITHYSKGNGDNQFATSTETFDSIEVDLKIEYLNEEVDDFLNKLEHMGNDDVVITGVSKERPKPFVDNAVMKRNGDIFSGNIGYNEAVIIEFMQYYIYIIYHYFDTI